MKRIRVTYSGTKPYRVRVVDAVTGAEIAGVVDVTIRMTQYEARAIIQIINPEIDVVAEAEIVPAGSDV